MNVSVKALTLNKVPDIPPGKWHNVTINIAIKDFVGGKFVETTREETVRAFGQSGLCVNGGLSEGFVITHIITGRKISPFLTESKLEASKSLLKLLRAFPDFDWCRDSEAINKDPENVNVGKYLMELESREQKCRQGLTSAPECKGCKCVTCRLERTNMCSHFCCWMRCWQNEYYPISRCSDYQEVEAVS